jgi:hypothetical protein
MSVLLEVNLVRNPGLQEEEGAMNAKIGATEGYSPLQGIPAPHTAVLHSGYLSQDLAQVTKGRACYKDTINIYSR